MWNKLEEIFLELGYPYSRQGSYAEDEELPNTFFTFWNNDTPETAFYDNCPHGADWQWYVYLYTKDANMIYLVMEEFVSIARAKGFTPSGRAKDIPTNEPDYFGRMLVLKYKENY